MDSSYDGSCLDRCYGFVVGCRWFNTDLSTLTLKPKHVYYPLSVSRCFLPLYRYSAEILQQLFLVSNQNNLYGLLLIELYVSLGVCEGFAGSRWRMELTVD